MAGGDLAGSGDGTVEAVGASDPLDDVAGLVAAAGRGDEAAWRSLVSRYADLVWAIARGHSLPACDAADVSQTTWMRLHEQLGRLDDPSRLSAWLVTTARREALRVLRARRRERLEAAPCLESVMPPADDALPDVERERERDALVWTAFAQLPLPCQVLLRALTSDPPARYSDLSEALGMPIGSIGPTRARCLDRLRGNLMVLSAARHREASS